MSGMSANFRRGGRSGRGRSGRGTLKKYIGDSMTLSCNVGSSLLTAIEMSVSIKLLIKLFINTFIYKQIRRKVEKCEFRKDHSANEKIKMF